MNYQDYLNDTYGGWIPGDYITADLDTTPYENKKGHLYMDFGPWADEKFKDDPAARDPALRKIYLSARMMKYHPLITKKLKTTYSLIAAAALKAMTKPGRYNVKKEFNKISGAMKAMSKKMKETKAPYGRVNRRGIFNKIDFWNRLIDLDIDNTPSESIAALLQGYEPASISGQEGYKFNGPIGTTANYDAYKTFLEARREEMRQKGLLLTDAEKKWYKQRARLLAKGRKRARDDIKAFKEAALANTAPFELAKYKPDRTLEDIYKSAFATEKAGDSNFYDGVTVDEMMAEIAQPNPKSWFQRAYEKYASERGADTIPGVPHYNKFSLTDRNAETDIRNLQGDRIVPYDNSRLLTADMRKQGLTAPPHLYIPANAKSTAASQAQSQLTSFGAPPPLNPSLAGDYRPYPTYISSDGVVFGAKGEPLQVDDPSRLPPNLIRVNATGPQIMEAIAKGATMSTLNDLDL